MRSVVVVVLLLLAALSGCAEPPADEPADAAADGAGDVPVAGGFVVSLMSGSSNFTVGDVLNLTLSTDLPIDVANNATWHVALYNGNAAAMDDNTTGAAPVAEASGNGAPAVVLFNLTAVGNHSLIATVSAQGYNASSAEMLLSVVAAEVVEVFDTPPAPLVFKGTHTGAPTMVLSGCPTSDDKTYTFNLAARVHQATFTLDFDDSLAGDLDWSISGPGGIAHAAEASGGETPKTFDLPPVGDWAVTVSCYSADIETDFTVTVEFT